MPTTVHHGPSTFQVIQVPASCSTGDRIFPSVLSTHPESCEAPGAVGGGNQGKYSALGKHAQEKSKGGATILVDDLGQGWDGHSFVEGALSPLGAACSGLAAVASAGSRCALLIAQRDKLTSKHGVQNGP